MDNDDFVQVPRAKLNELWQAGNDWSVNEYGEYLFEDPEKDENGDPIMPEDVVEMLTMLINTLTGGDS